MNGWNQVFLGEAELGEVEVFLEENFAGIEEESFSVVPHPEGGGDGWVYLSDTAIGFLKTLEHDCKNSGDDGCETCYMLQILGVIPEGDC